MSNYDNSYKKKTFNISKWYILINIRYYNGKSKPAIIEPFKYG